MNHLAERIRDIHEMDPVSWWPPALGWWLLALLALILLFLIFRFIHHLRAYPIGTWHRDARNQILALRRLSKQLSPEESIKALSELLRRIAIARLGREAAAGLTGEAWLQWLEEQDPYHFPWTQHGRLLLTVPYAPPGQYTVSQEEVQMLLQAALRWARCKRRGS